MDGRNGSSGINTCGTRGRLAIAGMFAASALLLAQPGVASAQTAQSDARWQPWLGCWQPSAPSPAGDPARPANADARAALVCVTPAAGTAAVDISTVVNGKVTSTERIAANGQQSPRTREGCTGWQSAEFSADGRRVYLRSQDNCSGVKRSATGMIAMSSSGEWLDVQGVTTGGRTGVRAVGYRDVGIPETLPAQIATALQGNARTVSEARAASAAPVATADVVEASRKVDAAVVRAWLLARGQGFAVDAAQLLKLADAGVPGEVTDAMVALSYPKTFAVVDPAAVGGAMQADRTALGTVGGYTSTGRTVQAYIDPYGYAYGYSPFGFGYSPYGYSGYGYSPYGYSGYGYPYAGYGFRGGFGGGYGYYNNPVIVLRGSGGQTPVEHGQAIKGYGYSRGRSNGSGPMGSGARSGGTNTPSGSGAARPASGGGRTAKPRP